FLLFPCPPISTLFPYTTLFRSVSAIGGGARGWNDWRFLLRLSIQRREPRSANRLLVGTMPSVGRQLARQLRELGQRAEADLRFRSEEHTSELQSQSNLVCRLLL